MLKGVTNMKLPACLRTAAAVGLVVLPLAGGATGPASAEPLSVPFSVAVGDTSSLVVRYLRATVVGQSPEPVLSVDYEMETRITDVSDDGIMMTVKNYGTNVALDRKRVLAPPDLDSLLLQAVDDLTAEIRLAPNGALDRVTNWEDLRGELIDHAKELAGDNDELLRAIDAFLPEVNAIDAVQLFARPLAMSAPGRVVTFDPPEGTSVNVEKLELPSFASYAAGRWSFDLVNRPDIPHNITVQWLGVPGASELKAILAPFTKGDDNVSDGKMWQRFTASYDDRDGKLLFFQGVMELKAGPFQRRIALEAQAKGR